VTTLYIANTTKQNHDFSYRRAEVPHPTLIKIPAGTQAVVIKDGDSGDVDRVIAQHRKYGLKPIAEAAKSKNFVGLCYSIDHPIKFKDMKVVFEHNDKALKDQGRKNVEEVAAAVNAGIDEKLQERGVPTEAAHVEVEVREENVSGIETEVALGAEVVKGEGQGRRRRR
jgi:hypothetical protein